LPTVRQTTGRRVGAGRKCRRRDSACDWLQLPQNASVDHNARQVIKRYFPLGYKGFTASIEVTS
jgi:putative alpha-1,2-mannosidase